MKKFLSLILAGMLLFSLFCPVRAREPGVPDHVAEGAEDIFEEWVRRRVQYNPRKWLKVDKNQLTEVKLGPGWCYTDMPQNLLFSGKKITVADLLAQQNSRFYYLFTSICDGEPGVRMQIFETTDGKCHFSSFGASAKSLFYIGEALEKNGYTPILFRYIWDDYFAVEANGELRIIPLRINQNAKNLRQISYLDQDTFATWAKANLIEPDSPEANLIGGAEQLDIQSIETHRFEESLPIWIPIAAGGAVALVAGAILFLLHRKKKKQV